MNNRLLDLIVDKELSQLAELIGFSSNIFMIFGLPTRKHPGPIFTKNTRLCTLKITNPNYQIPYGCYARMNQIFIDTEIKTKHTNIINVGSCFNDYVHKLGYSEGRANKALLRQLLYYVTSVITITPSSPRQGRALGLQTTVARKWDIAFDVKNPDQLMLSKGEIILDDAYAKWIHKHSVPLDMNVIRCFKRNPLALDFYRFLAYRNNNLHKPIAFPDNDLFAQFGTEQHADYVTRALLKNILKAIQMYWPVKAKFEDGYFLLEPSEPAVQHKIASSKPLRLVDKSAV